MKFPLAVLSVIETAPFDEAAVAGNPFPFKQALSTNSCKPTIGGPIFKTTIPLLELQEKAHCLTRQYWVIGDESGLSGRKTKQSGSRCSRARTMNSFRGDFAVR